MGEQRFGRICHGASLVSRLMYVVAEVVVMLVLGGNG